MNIHTSLSHSLFAFALLSVSTSALAKQSPEREVKCNTTWTGGTTYQMQKAQSREIRLEVKTKEHFQTRGAVAAVRPDGVNATMNQRVSISGKGL